LAGLAATTLGLSGFRSYSTAQLSLDERPLVLLGANGAGKTNILEAVSLLSPGRGLRRASAAEILRQPQAQGWKVAALIRRAGELHEIETWANAGSARQLRIDGKAAPQHSLGRLLPMIWLVPAMDRLWIEGAEGRRRFLDRMTLSFFPDHADAALDYEKSMRERNRLLRDGVQDIGWYRAIEARMAKAGAAISENRRQALKLLEAAQEDARTSFPFAQLSLVSRDDTDGVFGQDDLLAALADGRRRDMLAGRTLTGPHRADLDAIYAAKGVEARQCSTGEQKALLISLILANARAVSHKSGIPPIILLDEVVAHLDAGRRAALFDEICALGVQAWLTGTDAQLFTDLADRATFMQVCEGPDGSVISATDPP